MLYILSSIWMLHTSNLGWNMLLLPFWHKKLKKEEKARKLMQNLAHKSIFWPAFVVCGTQMPVEIYTSQFSFIAQTTLIKHILTGVCSLQSPNAGQNIYYPGFEFGQESDDYCKVSLSKRKTEIKNFNLQSALLGNNFSRI